MQSNHMIIESQVRDAALYDQYIQSVAPMVERYGGCYLARGGKITPLGSAWHPERVILLEFPAAENVIKGLSSPEYQNIAPLREQGADTKAVLVEGMINKA